MSIISDTESGVRIPGTSSHFLDPTKPGDPGQGRLRYVTGGTGSPLVLLHTVRTQAEHFRHLIPLVQERYTVYALDLPGMGYSQIVPGASYQEPAMRAAVESLMTQLDLHDVTLLGESMGGNCSAGVNIRAVRAGMRDSSRGVLYSGVGVGPGVACRFGSDGGSVAGRQR